MEVYRYGDLIPGRLVRRINRFVSEVLLMNEASLVVECYMANPGSMLGMCIKNAEVRVSKSPNQTRKFQYGVEAINIHGTWIGCNTAIANKIISVMLKADTLTELGIIPNFESFKHEVKEDNCRLDFVTCSSNGLFSTGIEVKTVTMASNWYDIETESDRADKPFHRFPTSRPQECTSIEGRRKALFPDCESLRALKHVEHLIRRLLRPNSASIFIFVVVRDDADCVGPSEYCDPIYASALRKADQSGVGLVGLRFKLHLEDCINSYITFEKRIPICFRDTACTHTTRKRNRT
jgi:sugar fermentation stimulation protein A